MIWISLFAFSAIEVVFRSCEGYNVKKSINADSSRVYVCVGITPTSSLNDGYFSTEYSSRCIMNDVKNREAMIGKVLESYVKPFKRLSANFPRHDVEIQLEFQRPQTIHQASKLIQKRPIYREIRTRPKVPAVHERGISGDYLAERNANEHYSVPSRNTMEYLPFENVARHGAVDNFGAGNVIDSFVRHNGMDNFGNHIAISNLAGHNAGMDFGSRNSMGNNAGYNEINNFAGNNAVDPFAGHNAMIMNYPSVYPMNHGVGNVIEQEAVQVAPQAPSVGIGHPQVARQAETESTTTEAAVTTSNVENKGPSLTLEDIRRLFDEYAEKIISSKSGNENQKSDNDQVPQVYIQDNNGQIDNSMLSNLDQIANLIRKGVQVYKVDENNQGDFLPKMGLNWMRIKVPVR